MATRKAGELIDGGEVLGRLWTVYGADSDGSLARAMKAGRSTVGAWRRRNSVPLDVCMSVARERRLSLTWLLSGEGNQEEPDPLIREAQELMARDLLGDDDAATAARFPGTDPAAIRRGREELARLASESEKRPRDSAQPFEVVPNDPKRTKPIAAPGFEAVIARLKEAIGLKNNAEAGELLGLDPATFKKLQKADLVPYEALMPVAYTRDINLQWLLYGEGEPSLSADHLHIGANGRAANLDLMQECIAALTAATRARLAEVDPRSFGRACVLLYEISHAAGRVATSSVSRLAETVLSTVPELETAEPRKRP